VPAQQFAHRACQLQMATESLQTVVLTWERG
jgi:hypothetical protein